MSHYFKITTILQEIPSARLKLAVRQALSWEVTGRLDPDSELAHTNWELSRAMGLEGDPRQQITRTMPLLVKEAARRWVEPDHDCQWLSWTQQAHRWQGRWVLGNFAGIGAAARVRDWNECNGGWWRAHNDAPWPAPQSFFPLENIRWMTPSLETVEAIEEQFDPAYHQVIARFHGDGCPGAIETVNVWRDRRGEPGFCLSRDPTLDTRNTELDALALVIRDQPR